MKIIAARILKFLEASTMDLERHCSNCAYPLNLAVNTVCDDCGHDNIVYEETLWHGAAGIDVVIHVNRQGPEHNNIWTTFWLWENKETEWRSEAQVMLSTAAKALPEAVANARKALTENPEAWGLFT